MTRFNSSDPIPNQGLNAREQARESNNADHGQSSGRSDDKAPPGPASEWASWLIAVWLLSAASAAIFALIVLWPLAEQAQQAMRQAASAGSQPATPKFPKFETLGIEVTLTPDVCIILLAILCGFVGSIVHALTHLSLQGPERSRQQKITRRRGAVWFVAAPIQGGLLAFLVIAAVAAGLLSAGQSTSSSTVNLFTIATLAGLTGLFSKRMTATLASLIEGVKDRGQPQSPTDPSVSSGFSASTADDPAHDKDP